MSSAPKTARVGIIAAMPVEARALGASVPANQISELPDHTLAYVCGIGPDNARRAVTELLAEHATSIVSWGTAGGLVANLVPGAALLASSVVCVDAAYETDDSWVTRLRGRLEPTLNISTQAIYSGGAPVAGTAQKKNLADETGAVAVDMESGAIAEMAVAAGVPFVCVRAVADPLRFSLPDALGGAIDSDGFISVSSVLHGLMRRPADTIPMLRLAMHFHQATRTLALVSRLAGPRLLGT